MAKSFRYLRGGGDAPLDPVDAAGEMNEAQRDLGLGRGSSCRERREIGVVRPVARHRHVDEIDRRVHRAPQPVRHIHHVAHVDGLDRMAVVVVAVAEMEEQIDTGRDAVAELRGERREIGRRFVLGRAVRAKSPRWSTANTAEAISNWIARSDEGSPRRCGPTSPQSRRCKAARAPAEQFDDMRAHRRMRRREIDLEFRAGGDLAFIAQTPEHRVQKHARNRRKAALRSGYRRPRRRL